VQNSLGSVVKRKEIKKDNKMKENGKALHRHDISDRLWEKIVEWLMTIDTLSMLYLGLSEPAFLGETYLLNTETGKIHIEDFAAGGIGMSGKQ
jgi:hypothetical protein